ncbi:MAG: choline-sulfatase [Verrucomicrobiales bacterium]|nr:choline-sulfatase [Verrucomicrobiales bacterium]|tara:strand:+ start:1556 stop:2941 length:1386 start_codon:yes stop_codon:yes gene_type:complete
MSTIRAFCLLLLSALALAAARPNIVFLFADDMRPDAIGALGHPVIKTPNLDKLIREGTTFTRAITAYPICHVSRAEIFSGRSAFRSGYHYRGRDYKEGITLWPEAMRSAGYQTWYIGKWHSPRDAWKTGFDETRGLYSGGGGGAKASVPQYDYKGRLVTGYRGWTFKTDKNKPEPEKGIGLTPDISARFADAAIELIDRKPDKPFFMQVNFTAPHDPLLKPPGHNYNPAKIPLPANYRPQHPFDHGNFNGRDERLLPWPRTKSDIKADLAVYYAVIAHMDEQIGRIVSALKKNGQWENTILIFSADHGLAVGSHGLMGKQNQYEHSIGVPLIFAGGGIPRGLKVDAPCYLRDLYPTTCELAGVPVPGSVQSASLASVFKNPKARPHKFVVGYFTNTQRMIRKDGWKLIWYPHLARYQLFDLKNDPHELTNLFSHNDHTKHADKLRHQLDNWLRDHGDPLFD